MKISMWSIFWHVCMRGDPVADPGHTGHVSSPVWVGNIGILLEQFTRERMAKAKPIDPIKLNR